MNLMHYVTPGEPPIVVCEFPDSLMSSRRGLESFFRLYAGRIFGGREGRDWRFTFKERELVPISVNQLVPSQTGGMDYGQQLTVE
jgi:hypothetical protein